MSSKKKIHPTEKPGMHPDNRFRHRYDLPKLIESCPDLAPFVVVNKFDDETIEFSNPDAVKMLNKALLVHHYGLEYWDIPSGYLSPPIPGRAEYLHHIAEFLGKKKGGVVPKGGLVNCLDIGVGAGCIYPIIGHKEFGWSFMGTDIDPKAIRSAQKIVDKNKSLEGKINFRLQNKKTDIFNSIIKKHEFYDLSICNPPFHSSAEEAQAGTMRKLKNLGRDKVTEPVLNFGGQSNELWCEGGERKFVTNMVVQSKHFSHSCRWFSTLVSKSENLKPIYAAIKQTGALEMETLPISHGNKTSRIVVWTFLPN
ncbi:23S rRNA (adenine(1618)-N(6))-methyltransferase RlmF [Marivirga sp. S37H4]|uniref:Ribosomal RNA large subunit methyltransferase F n=1 Tax=Marivirga aurantiaca TaxID=2802615 RepID=A0A934WVQ9_9BACT|nr:23S rRNA (adenine(1618)-N(6))-methyltransferase RlmF [Marivirga aurantiaca]MBK6263933.1 23S rRNA (adenine(1618)-N(6))-methyltransferase RlmF [Marivirga aurantiaca]